MTLPDDLLLRTPEEAARRIALSFLEEAHDASLRLDDPNDAEALHDFRVGIRRLRSTIRAWKDRLRGTVSKKQRAALKALQNATGGGRDAEVALTWLESQRADLRPVHRRGLGWMVDRLTRRREAAMAHVCEDVRRDFAKIESSLQDALEVLRLEVHLVRPDRDPTFAEALAKKAREHAAELVLHLARIASLDDKEEAHQARIMGKRLRYLIEPIRPWFPQAVDVVKRTKRLQDVLGDLNDAHVLRAELGDALEASAIEHARRLHDLVDDGDLEAMQREMRQSERSGLLEIARRSQQRARKLFSRLEKDWLMDAGAALLASVDALAGTLERLARRGVEIERKYLLESLPDLPEDVRVVEIEQGWLPGKELRERLRKIRSDGKDEYLRTVKLGRGVQRLELEEETSAKVYEALWPLTEGCRVRKRRYEVPEGDRVWEIDEFLDRELFLAEIELERPDEEVRIPAWLEDHVEKDVTGDERYVNLTLAQ